MSVLQFQEGQVCRISGLNGNSRFISRAASVGLTPGAEIRTIRN